MTLAQWLPSLKVGVDVTMNVNTEAVGVEGKGGESYPDALKLHQSHVTQK